MLMKNVFYVAFVLMRLEVFELGDERAEVKVDEVPEEHEECCHEAADSCPTDAIEIDDD